MDVLLVERHLVTTRTKAQALILAGRVKVNDRVVTKSGLMVSRLVPLLIEQGPKFVSRGGEKLEGALSDFGVSPEGLICLDVGASTGGFTDCLLKAGAKKVYAVDVGHGQLDYSLQKDPRVQNMEKTHILSLQKNQLAEPPQLVVLDLSFISLRSVLTHVKGLLGNGVTVLPMIKPQFEVGAKNLKKGVVKSPEINQKAVEDMIGFAKQEGFLYVNCAPARLMGPRGNQEYFLHLKVSS